MTCLSTSYWYLRAAIVWCQTLRSFWLHTDPSSNLYIASTFGYLINHSFTSGRWPMFSHLPSHIETYGRGWMRKTRVFVNHVKLAAVIHMKETYFVGDKTKRSVVCQRWKMTTWRFDSIKLTNILWCSVFVLFCVLWVLWRENWQDSIFRSCI